MAGLVGRIEGSGSGESGPGDSGKVALLQRAEFIGNHVRCSWGWFQGSTVGIQRIQGIEDSSEVITNIMIEMITGPACSHC